MKGNERLKTHNFRHWKLFACIVLVILIAGYLILRVLDALVTPQIIALAQAHIRERANRWIQELSQELIASQKIGECIEMQTSDDGTIELIRIDTNAMNMLGLLLAEELQNKINAEQTFYIDLSLGAILGSQILNDYGPIFHFPCQPIAHAIVNLKSTFSEAGINQTRHKVTADIVLNVRIVLPSTDTFDENISTSISLYETIFMGDTPETYFYNESDGILPLIP